MSVEIKSVGADGENAFRLFGIDRDTRLFLCSSSEPKALEIWAKHWVEDGQDAELPWVYFNFPLVRWVTGSGEFGTVLYGRTEWSETTMLTPDMGEPVQAGYGGWYYTAEIPPQI